MSTSMTNVFIHETGAEILKSLRAPEFILPTLLLPVAFYTFFGVAMPGSAQNAPYLLATYGVFAVMGPSIFGFGAGVANERERGWLKLKRAAPAPAITYIGAKLLTTLIVATLALAPVYAVAGFAGGVEFTRSIWLMLLATHMLAVIPFVLIGLALGFTLSASGAVAVSNIVFLGLSALGGLWIPIFMFPEALQKIAFYLPSFHLGELALSIVDAPGTHFPKQNLLMIGGMTGVAAILSLVAWARQR